MKNNKAKESFSSDPIGTLGTMESARLVLLSSLVIIAGAKLPPELAKHLDDYWHLYKVLCD